MNHLLGAAVVAFGVAAAIYRGARGFTGRHLRLGRAEPDGADPVFAASIEVGIAVLALLLGSSMLAGGAAAVIG